MNYTQIEQQFNDIVNPKIQSIRQKPQFLSQSPQIQSQHITNQIIIPELQKLRFGFIENLSSLTKRNTICYYSSFVNTNAGNPEFSITDNDINGFMNAINGMDKTLGLDLVLHTPGGSVTATESIVSYLRSIFGDNIRTIVPHLAMSAGTMICCASNTIIMGKQSSLGPIDPQFRGVSAEGVIEEFETAIQQTIVEPNRSLIWKEIISKYPPTFVGDCQKAVDLSKELVTSWLETGMFKSDPNKLDKIMKVVDHITSHAKTKVHDRHFDISKCKEIGFNIVQMENDQTFQDAILSLHHSLVLSSNVDQALIKLIENNSGQTWFTRGQR
jgi:ATP-dependent protease ClpP protease subunit